MGIMLDYLRNKNDIFKRDQIHLSTQDEITDEIKKAFKYTQKVLREDYELIRVRKQSERKEQQKEEEKRDLVPEIDLNSTSRSGFSIKDNT